MGLLFVFMLASGAVLYQPESEENCAKLMLAFAKGEKVTATVAGREAAIVYGVCIPTYPGDELEQLFSTVPAAPAS